MEIKRKKITQEEIYSHEQNSAQKITEICDMKNDAFLAIGYELDLELGQKENEHQSRFEIFSRDEDKKYESGYVSRAMITVKRQKTEAEKEEELRMAQEIREALGTPEDPAEEALEADGEALPDGEDENRRSVAVTQVMLVRVYKAFWTEWVCLGEDAEQLENDLDEFLKVLMQRQDETADF